MRLQHPWHFEPDKSSAGKKEENHMDLKSMNLKTGKNQRKITKQEAVSFLKNEHTP